MLPGLQPAVTIDRIRAGTKDSDYGNTTVLDWDPSAVTEISIPGCYVQPDTSQKPSEYTVDRDNVMTRHEVWAPDGSDITAVDRIRHKGDIYEVDGEIQEFDAIPLSHLVFRIRRSKG